MSATLTITLMIAILAAHLLLMWELRPRRKSEPEKKP